MSSKSSTTERSDSENILVGLIHKPHGVGGEVAVESLSDALGRLLDDEDARLDLVARGLERAKTYSWERTARKTFKVYELVAGS